MKPRILLDMDGVLVNFVAGICGALGVRTPYDGRQESLGVWDMTQLMGLPAERFWAPCNYASFWSHLAWMEDGRELLRACENAAGVENVFLLTAPSLSPEAWKGKAEWVEKHLPGMRSRLLMGSCKYLCARPGHILVDDSDANIATFREKGGQAVLVPRPWNAGHAVRDAVKRVRAELDGELNGFLAS